MNISLRETAKKLIPRAFLLAVIFLLFNTISFAATTTVCSVGCDHATIEAAVAAAAPGDTINISAETFTPVSSITIPVADLTITGAWAWATIINTSSVTGTNLFMIPGLASGFTLENVEIIKTDLDTVVHEIIAIIANNVTIQNNTIHGTFSYPLNNGSPASRAMVISGGLSGLTIQGNTIYSMRQPAYISGVTTGNVTNNIVYGTKGWVIENGNLSFTGNSWGDGSQPNVVDFAILGTVNPSFYTDIAAMSAANNNASIEDQRSSPAVLSDVYVDDSAAPGGNGTVMSPYQTITPALTRVAVDGRIHIADGVYSESLTLSKDGADFIGQSKSGVQITAGAGYGIDITGINGVSFEDMTFNVGVGTTYHLKAYQSSGIVLDNVEFNGTGSGTTPRVGGIDFNSTSNVTLTDVSAHNYTKNGIAITAKYEMGDTASANYAFTNVSVANNAWNGIAFYPFNGSGTVSDDIVGVTFSDSNSISGSGQTGLLLAGASDADMGTSTAPTRTVSGPGGSILDLSTWSISANTLYDLVNYQTTDVDATGTTFNGKTGSTMTAGEVTSQDGKILDFYDNANLGVVDYVLPYSDGPAVIINQAVGQADPVVNVNEIKFTVVFSRAIDSLTFTCADITLVNASCGSITLVSGNMYTVTVWGHSTGSVTASIPWGVVADMSGKLNATSTSTDNTVMLTISGGGGSGGGGSTIPNTPNNDDDCEVGQDYNNGQCLSCTTKPSNSLYDTRGTCDWTCSSGYMESGNQCVLDEVDGTPINNNDEESNEELICEAPLDSGNWYRKCEMSTDLSGSDAFYENMRCEGVFTKNERTSLKSRQEIVGIALKMRKKNETITFISPGAYRNIFTDVGTSNFYIPIIETALAEGLITSQRSIFEPTKNVTRSEAYGMIMTAVCLSPSSTDLNWQERIHDAAFRNGITNKSWADFRPNAPIQARELHVLTARAADWAETTGGCNPKPLECN